MLLSYRHNDHISFRDHPFWWSRLRRYFVRGSVRLGRLILLSKSSNFTSEYSPWKTTFPLQFLLISPTVWGPKDFISSVSPSLTISGNCLLMNSWMSLGYIKKVSRVMALMLTTNSSRINPEKLKPIPAARETIAPVFHRDISSVPNVTSINFTQNLNFFNYK